MCKQVRAAPRPEEQHAASTSCECVAGKIEFSKRHWSELSEPSGDDITPEEAAKAKLANQAAFRIWKLHPKGRTFFKTFGNHFQHWKAKAQFDNEDDFRMWQLHLHSDIFKTCHSGKFKTFGPLIERRQSVGSLEVGEKFAEGAQAELFHARVNWSNLGLNKSDLEDGVEWVLKVFKQGTLVQDLQSQCPEGLLCYREEIQKLLNLGKPPMDSFICSIECATLLEDGRLAFLMEKQDGDLRSLIDRKMVKSDHGCGPFSKEGGEDIMHQVASGMDVLHKYNIIHRDLKASNVLVLQSRPSGTWFWCYVADFESSVGVVGTGFWRAPEILRALREKNVGSRLELFSREADSYSYGMTCYEVLTGRVPFEDRLSSEQHSLLIDLVIDQHLRPEVPDYVEDWARDLHWCWKPVPNQRPSFKEILGVIEANSDMKYIHAVKKDTEERSSYGI